MLERPLEIFAALLRRRDKYALYWRQEVSVEGPLQGSKLQVPQVTVSPGTINFLVASFMWSQCRGVACPWRASFARVSQQFRFRVRLHLLCASLDPIFGGPFESDILVPSAGNFHISTLDHMWWLSGLRRPVCVVDGKTSVAESTVDFQRNFSRAT